MKNSTFKANFGNLENIDNSLSPDVYSQGTKKESAPKGNFIISKTPDSRVLSRYQDDIWDLTPYRLVGSPDSNRINFSLLVKKHRSEAKWIIFIVLFLSDSGKASGPSIQTVVGYMKLIRALSRFSASNDLSLYDYFNKKTLIRLLIKNLNNITLLRNYSSLSYNIYTLGSSNTKIKVLNEAIHVLVKEKINNLSKHKQHPVIPPRIYSNLLDSINDFFLDFKKIKSDFFIFLDRVLSNENFARSESQLKKLGNINNVKYHSTFDTESCKLGLSKYFLKHNIFDIPSFCSFVSKVQHACKLMIHIYTGMRQSEVLGLEVGCTEKESKDLGYVYKLSGNTSKLVGQKKQCNWITSLEAYQSTQIAERIAFSISQKLSIQHEDIPLFISTGYIFTKWDKDDSYTIKISKTGSKTQEFYNLVSKNIFSIKDEDIQFLNLIDPFRSWETEEKYQINKTWRFTSHQFRRSLAYYIAQSSLVSLPSLKRQLRHITRDMTLYYCQHKDTENLTKYKDMSNLFIKNKYKSDFSSYILDVINSEEKLYGVTGKHIEKRIDIHDKTREELEHSFKKGEIAYKTTPLGSCTSTSPCMSRASVDIAACIPCDKAIIKKSKLERVIKIKKSFLDSFDDNDSVEYRSEKSELSVLTKFYSTINK